ncbi:hypothetical protein HOY80DRAFT_251079 [Tuber brumale]|nr:hypothetical protein HOY80DRAFT_251079 [Tuber brumale]
MQSRKPWIKLFAGVFLSSSILPTSTSNFSVPIQGDCNKARSVYRRIGPYRSYVLVPQRYRHSSCRCARALARLSRRLFAYAVLVRGGDIAPSSYCITLAHQCTEMKGHACNYRSRDCAGCIVDFYTSD